MKIVSVMTTSARGGAEFAAVEMLDALRARGHETVMLSDQPHIARDTGVPVRAISLGPKLSGRTWRTLLLQWPRLVGQLHAALAAEAPFDVLLLHYKKEQLMALALPRELLGTLVWAEWGPVPFAMRQGFPNMVYRLASRRASLVMAVSAGTRESVCEAGVPRSKVLVVPNVMRIDAIRFTGEGRQRVRESLGIPQDAFVVGCISRFHPKKRNDVVIDAVARLPGVYLILAGDGDTEAELRARAEPIGKRAHFIPTPGADVDEVLSAFDVLVFCPSPTEGAPRAVILGMLTQRPCLATGAEGVSDMISPGMGAICTPENDPAVLAELLRPYLADADLRHRHGAAAREWAERVYAAPVVADQIERLFAAAISSRSR